MEIRSASTTIVTSTLPETRRFYEEHLGARPVFDCGWYVVLRFGLSGPGPEICLMEPQGGAATFSGGATLNLLVQDADKAHAGLAAAGVPVVVPLEDHPWGDRGFGVVDPSGVAVYCYHPIAPAPEFQQFLLED